ncbi:trypsin-like serine protease [Vibrio cholerae]|nr:trypsin-like serine protease [Vibrio cholerae]
MKRLVVKKVSSLLACSIASLFFPATVYPVSIENVSPYIINGSDALLGEWPSIVALVERGQTASVGQFCGGSFLGKRYVLTAAHCVASKEAKDLDAIIGINNLINENDEGVRVAVRRIYLHEDYVHENLLNDIAVLELENEVQAPPIVIADSSTRVSDHIGEPLKVAGWGSASPIRWPWNTSESILQYADVDLIEQSECYRTMSGYNPYGITVQPDSENFCAGSIDKKSACRGDSGGPIVLAGSGVQLGIVSWGPQVCAADNTYSVYTNINYFTDWISDHIRGFSYESNVYLEPVPLAPFTHSLVYNSFSDIPINFIDIEISNSSTNPRSLVSIINDDCSGRTLRPDESCNIDVRFSPNFYQIYQYTINANILDNGLPVAKQSNIQFQTLRSANQEIIEALSELPKTSVLTTKNGWERLPNNALRSGVTGDGDSSSLIVKGIPKGSLFIQMNVSAEYSDKLQIYINRKLEKELEGFSNAIYSVALLEDLNTLEFRYVKDQSVASGKDAAFIEKLYYNEIPIIIAQPSSSEVGEVTTVTSTVNTDSAGSLNFLTLFLSLLCLFRRRISA